MARFVEAHVEEREGHRMNARDRRYVGTLGIVLLLAVLVGSPRAETDEGPAARGLGARLEALVREGMASGLTPGMAVAVVQGNEVWEIGLGMADREAKRSVTPRTSFYLASTSKAFTATAAVGLAARGKLDLNAPISRALPGARLAQGVAAESILVRDLLTHTHGIDPNGPISLRVAFTGTTRTKSSSSSSRHTDPRRRGVRFSIRTSDTI
jgi:CubicO group peptidase (beta-lactamase class C family)